MTGDEEETVWSGKYIVAKRRGRWEYAGRARGIGAAVILAQRLVLSRGEGEKLVVSIRMEKVIF